MTMKKLLLSVLMLALALPAFALDIPMPDGMKLNMYGQARMAAYYQRQTEKPNGGEEKITKSDLFYNMQGNSRLGWNFSAGSFKANVELKVVPDSTTSKTAPVDGTYVVKNNGLFRQFWGAYTFENGLTLTAGNKTTIAGNAGYFNDIYGTDQGLNGYGNIGDVRRPLIMLSYAGLDFAMITNEMDHDKKLGANTVKENYIPRFEVAYNLKMDGLSGKFFAAYGRFNYADADKQWIGINSWHVGAHVNPTFGNMYVKVGAYYGQNVGLDGSISMSLVPEAVKNGTDVEVKNTSSFGGALAFGIKDLVPSLSLELGAGYALYTTEVDDVENKSAYAVYLQTPYKVNQHVLIIPQVGYYATAQDKVKDTADIMAGLQLRMLF